MKKILTLLLLAPLFGMSQQTPTNASDAAYIKKLSDEILTNGKAYDLLYELTKKVGGRIAGSPAMYKAEAWGEKTLQQLGAPVVIKQHVWCQDGCVAAEILRASQVLMVKNKFVA